MVQRWLGQEQRYVNSSAADHIRHEKDRLDINNTNTGDSFLCIERLLSSKWQWQCKTTHLQRFLLVVRSISKLNVNFCSHHSVSLETGVGWVISTLHPNPPVLSTLSVSRYSVVMAFLQSTWQTTDFNFADQEYADFCDHYGVNHINSSP